MLYDIDWLTNPQFPHIVESDDGVDIQSATILIIHFHNLRIEDHSREVERLINAISRNSHRRNDEH